MTDSQPDRIVDLTEKARARVASAMAKEGRPNALLRLSVVKGGCSGYEYSIKFVDAGEDDDLTYQIDQLSVLVAADSVDQLRGTMLDYADGLYGAGLKFVNPNATHACGCGASFATEAS